MNNSRISHVLFFCLLFVGMATVSPIIHNDDGRHTVHPLAHSAVCKWVKEGKLCRATPAAADLFPCLLISFALLFFSLPPRGAFCTPLFSFKTLCTGTRRNVRAPPF